MIHVVTGENKKLYARELDAQALARHQVFVEERKWEDLARADKRERDQFDTDRTIYFLAIDDERVVGGSRLVETEGPHMLSEVFPQLASVQGVPSSPDVYEWSRIWVARDRRASGGILHRLFAGILEFCLDEEIHSLTGVVEIWALPFFSELGWIVQPLGLPQLIANSWTLGVRLDVSQKPLQCIYDRRRIAGPVLVRRNLPRQLISARTEEGLRSSG
jgi:acyl-homoserine lactone synthase